MIAEGAAVAGANKEKRASLKLALPPAPGAHNVWSDSDWRNLHYTLEALSQTDERGRHSRGLPAHLRYAEKLTEGGKEARLARYNVDKQAFEAALATLPEARADVIRAVLEVLRLIDHEHAVVRLIRPFLSNGQPSIEKLKIQFL
jgi:hypothetical protein